MVKNFNERFSPVRLLLLPALPPKGPGGRVYAGEIFSLQAQITTLGSGTRDILSAVVDAPLLAIARIAQSRTCLGFKAEAFPVGRAGRGLDLYES